MNEPLEEPDKKPDDSGKSEPSEVPKESPTSEERCNKRTAEHLVRRLGAVSEELVDLFADFRTFDRYEEIGRIGWVLRTLHDVRMTCNNYVKNGVWEDD